MKQVLIFLISIILFTSCERVAPNYGGVLMENFGKNGKEDFSIVKGRVNTMAPGTELFQVPLWEQRATFENELHLQDADRAEYTATPLYSYEAIEESIVDLVFRNKHLGSGDSFMKELENNILEPQIYDVSKDMCRSWTTEQITKQGGNIKFEKVIQPIIDSIFKSYGLRLKTFTLQLNPSEKVREKIDNRNEVNTTISVIDQEIEAQKKRNELARLKSEENRIYSEGLTPKLLYLKFIEKWDGKSSLYGDVPSFMKQVQ